MTELQKRAKEYLTLKGVKSTGDKFIALEVMDLLCEFAQREQLIIGGVSTRFLNISGIIEISDEAERSFFNWLTCNGIWWTQRGSNLRNITVYEKDIQTIKNTWHEVNVC